VTETRAADAGAKHDSSLVKWQSWAAGCAERRAAESGWCN